MAKTKDKMKVKKNIKKTAKTEKKFPDINTWNYRVLNHGTHYSIHEVYYEKDKPVAWTEDAMIPVGETYDEFKEDMFHFFCALGRPVLIIKKNKLYEE
jgi:hypothetical protein